VGGMVSGIECLLKQAVLEYILSFTALCKHRPTGVMSESVVLCQSMQREVIAQLFAGQCYGSRSFRSTTSTHTVDYDRLLRPSQVINRLSTCIDSLPQVKRDSTADSQAWKTCQRGKQSRGRPRVDQSEFSRNIIDTISADEAITTSNRSSFVDVADANRRLNRTTKMYGRQCRRIRCGKVAITPPETW